MPLPLDSSSALATLECIENWNSETKALPKFRLSFDGHVWEFREHSQGAASAQARWFLDKLVFGRGDQPWFEGMDKRRITYRWIDSAQQANPCDLPPEVALTDQTAAKRLAKEAWGKL